MSLCTTVYLDKCWINTKHAGSGDEIYFSMLDYSLHYQPGKHSRMIGKNHLFTCVKHRF